MNDTAARLGLTGSHFTNPHGLPDPDHYSTPHDLAVLGRHLIIDFPEYYHYFSEIDFTYNNIKQGNRNPLLYETQGADGIKTGHTEELGYSLAGSVRRGDRRVIFVLTGLTSMRERSRESASVVEWAFREFQNYPIAKKGDVFEQADVWLGTDPKVPLLADADLTVTMSRVARHDLKVTLNYEAPIVAPVVPGVRAGTLTATGPDLAPQTIGLVTGGSVAKLGPIARIGSAIDYLIWRGKT
jgi:D-alanyl-D-alanine carboxypeptidase (penicillin-binding protein 5/6)